MVADDLAQAVGEISRLAASAPHKCLRRLVEIAAQAVPGCAGATSALWHREELAFSAATHPDLAALLDRQLARGSGPVLDAVRTGGPASCIDTLAESGARYGQQRWPEYAADALGVGVRCSATLVHKSGQLLVALTLDGTKPRALDPETLPVASLLAAIGAISLANASRHESWRRTAARLEEMISARAVVDQAKGLLMNAHGWNADEALARLRDLSQARHVDVLEAARWLIDEHSRVQGAPRLAQDPN
jgi:ANTAR domain